MQAGAVVVYVGKDNERFEEVFNSADSRGGPLGHIVRGTTFADYSRQAEEAVRIRAWPKMLETVPKRNQGEVHAAEA